MVRTSTSALPLPAAMSRTSTRRGPIARGDPIERVFGTLCRLGDLDGLEAARAEAQMSMRAVDHGVAPLEVREGALLGLVVGMAHLVADQGALAADIALESHVNDSEKGRGSLPETVAEVKTSTPTPTATATSTSIATSTSASLASGSLFPMPDARSPRRETFLSTPR